MAQNGQPVLPPTVMTIPAAVVVVVTYSVALIPVVTVALE